ncbi:MAG: cupredoxin domain-containing protein [Chloroflexi bacterium]|nr:cupredoxin domain-containing protein [Chloroflexota bacterium]
MSRLRLPTWEFVAGVLLALVVLGVPVAVFAYNAYLGDGGVQEITLVAGGSRWHPETIQVEAGKPVRLRLVSHDVVHGFLLQDQEQDLLIYPGKVTVFEFTPKEAGTLGFVCTVACGPNHPTMAGQIIVGDVPPTPTPEPLPPLSPLAEKGRKLVQSQGCMTCHTTGSKAGMAPTWRDLWGSTITLKDGSTVVADETYLRESIYDPNAKIVKGFSSGVMLSYKGMLSEDAVKAVIEFIKELGGEHQGTPPPGDHQAMPSGMDQ